MVKWSDFFIYILNLSVISQASKLVEYEIDNSFPSDHTILFFSICFSFWLTDKKGKWLWLVLAFSVAVSRVWVGVHYPIDVMIGAIIGTGSSFIVYKLIPKLSIMNQFRFYQQRER